MFADVGNHFRAGYTLGFWGKEMLGLPGVSKTEWLSFPGRHGKGMCDAQGGRMTRWLEQAAKKTVIATCTDFCRVLNSRAAIAEKPWELLRLEMRQPLKPSCAVAKSAADDETLLNSSLSQNGYGIN